MKHCILVIAMFLTAVQAFAATDPADTFDTGDNTQATALCRNCLHPHERASNQMLNGNTNEDRAEAMFREDSTGPNGSENGEISEGAGG
ncbi:MAG: hypothetical protein HRT45_18085 [Bdellovibrionales bacterium]|nr:hypothetical protein [Bdellovibrionales bacterium]